MTQNESLNTDLMAILVDHYQKTYELTLEMWKYRNRIFLYLVGSISIASLLIFRVPESQGLLIDALASILNIQDAGRINALRTTFPFAIFQSSLLILVFYLMVNLYNRSYYVLRNYQYLSELENEIREYLLLSDKKFFFTREGKFYWRDRPAPLGWVKFCYIFIIGGLLVAFIAGLFFFNPTISIGWILDVPIVIATVVFFIAYARASFYLDAKK